MNFLCLDIGTTLTKVEVIDEKGNIIFYKNKGLDLLTLDGYSYVDILTIVKIVKDFIKEASEFHRIDSIAISSIGESFVTLDKDDNILTYPMLYTDTRGMNEALKYGELFKNEYFYRTKSS